MSARKSKNYSDFERKTFLQILVKYKNVIETKKSNAVTLREKEIAWAEICQEFNTSRLVTAEVRCEIIK